MSVELQDLRCKVTPEAAAALEALNRATGRDKSEIAREVLHRWAEEQIHFGSLLAEQLEAKGIAGNASGTRGKPRESQGRSGNRGESQG